jgi:hypothetical protein
MRPIVPIYIYFIISYNYNINRLDLDIKILNKKIYIKYKTKQLKRFYCCVGSTMNSMDP